MTTLAVHRRRPVVPPAARQLGAVEARRMVRHPAYPVAMLYIAVFTVSMVMNDQGGPPANSFYIVLMLALLLVYAPMTLVTANRIAAGTYQRRVRDILDGTPVDAHQRTVAVAVGLLRGPVLVAVGGAVVLMVLGTFTSSAVADRSAAVYQRTALEYVQLPALVLGAGLLGIALARWLPRPGVLPLAAIAIWLGTIAMYPLTASDLAQDRAWFALWPVWLAGANGMLPRQPLGQEMGHLAYLLGLGALAGTAALLRTDTRSRRLWAGAAVAAVVTCSAAWLQLGR